MIRLAFWTPFQRLKISATIAKGMCFVFFTQWNNFTNSLWRSYTLIGGGPMRFWRLKSLLRQSASARELEFRLWTRAQVKSIPSGMLMTRQNGGVMLLELCLKHSRQSSAATKYFLTGCSRPAQGLWPEQLNMTGDGVSVVSLSTPSGVCNGMVQTGLVELWLKLETLLRLKGCPPNILATCLEGKRRWSHHLLLSSVSLHWQLLEMLLIYAMVIFM